jgi:hypothetical protein
MHVSQIEIFRDGGTIVFTISDDLLAGKFRLQTPFQGKPQPLFRDERKLEFGSAEEIQIAIKLNNWLHEKPDEISVERMAELDKLKEWRNLPSSLRAVIPYHRIRHVVRIIEERLPKDNPAQ